MILLLLLLLFYGGIKMKALLLNRVIKCQKGAMDKILVTLLLVIVGVGAVIGLKSWTDSQVDAVKSAATVKIQEVSK